jgi:hypothetical protein
MHRYKPIVYEIIADMTDPSKPLRASQSIKRLDKLERDREFTTPSRGKHLNNIYSDATQKLKTAQNKKHLQVAEDVHARRNKLDRYTDQCARLISQVILFIAFVVNMILINLM